VKAVPSKVSAEGLTVNGAALQGRYRKEGREKGAKEEKEDVKAAAKEERRM
jgi:hypothetical protein